MPSHKLLSAPPIGIDAAIQNHRDLSPLSEQYCRFLQGRSDLNQEFDLGHMAPVLLQWGLTQRASLLIDEAFNAKLDEACRSAGELLSSLPRRVCQADAELATRFWGLTNIEVARQVLLEAGGYEDEYYRVDLIYGETGFKAIELNSGPRASGFYASEWLSCYAGFAPTAAFLAEHGQRLTCRDPRLDLLGHVLSRAQRLPALRDGAALNVFFSIAEQATVPMQAYLDGMLGALPAALTGRVRLFAGQRADLAVGPDGVSVDGVAMHALILGESGLTRALFDARQRNQVLLFDTPTSYFSLDKRNFALATSLRQDGWFSTTECEQLDRLLPWTALMLPGPVRFEGVWHDLRALALEQRARWVLKSQRGHGGEGVLVGNFTDACAWQAAIDRYLGEPDWILQEFFPSKPFVMLDKGQGLTQHDVVWGVFVFGGMTSGGTIRTKLSADTDGVINVSRQSHEGLYCIHGN